MKTNLRIFLTALAASLSKGDPKARSTQKPRKACSPLRFALLIALLVGSAGAARAGSATWDLTPVTSSWNTAGNWTPDIVPDGTGDVATFDVSNQTNVTVTITDPLLGDTVVSDIVFTPAASAYTISIAPPHRLLVNGAGVTNNSGNSQNFVTSGDRAHTQSTLSFAGGATAGDATYTNFGAIVKSAFGGHVEFFNTATAGTGTFEIGGGAVNQADGAGILFFEASSAGSGTFHINGGAVNGAGYGDVEFIHTSTADHATLIADGGLGGAAGGKIFFFDDSKGGASNITVSGNGNLDLSFHNPPGVTVGSVQGDGMLFLGSTRLTVNNRSGFTFAGVIADGGFNGGVRGAFAKSGRGTLNLTGASSYTGGTTITAGTLLVGNASGSATGTGAVQVTSGTLGGGGTIAGAVTIGSGGSGSSAFLTPGQSFKRPGLLTILGSLTFNPDGIFNAGLTRNLTVGEVVANGVTISSGATFTLSSNGSVAVPVGTVLTLISNTSATPIAGAFQNLTDGTTLVDHGNKFQVSYQGGDGNDLTLTSVL